LDITYRPPLLEALAKVNRQCIPSKSKKKRGAQDGKEAEINAKKLKYLLTLWRNLVDIDVNIRNRLAQASVFTYFLFFIEMKGQPEISLHFLECFKPFFTSPAQQKLMVTAGVIEEFSKLIETTQSTELQRRIFDIFMYFDAKYQSTMIKNGILKHLARLINSDKQTGYKTTVKCLSVVAYLVDKHGDAIYKHGILRSLLDILQESTNVSVQRRSIDLLVTFQKTHEKQLLEMGYLKSLLFLFSSFD